MYLSDKKDGLTTESRITEGRLSALWRDVFRNVEFEVPVSHLHKGSGQQLKRNEV